MVYLRTYFDPELGCIGAAIDADGRIVATGSSHVENHVYIAIDEAALFEATGELLPLPGDA